MGLFSWLKPLAGVALPVLGGIAGGPLGGLAGGALGGLINRPGKPKPSGMNTSSNGYAGTQQQNTGLYNTLQGMLPGAQQQSNELSGEIGSGYRNFGSTFGDPNNNPSMGTFNEFSHSGGIDPKARGQLEGVIGQEGDLAGWGRGMMDTGGFTNADKANYRARGTSNVPSFFSSLKDTLGQQNAAQGGFNPGYTAQMSKLARDQAHESQKAVFDTEAGLHDAMDRNKFAGAGVTGSALNSQSSSLMNLIDSIQKGRLAGASGASQAYGQAGQFAGQGLAGLTDLYRSNPGMLTSLLQLMQGNIGQSGTLDRYAVDQQQNNRDYNYGRNRDLVGGGLGLLQALAPFLGGRKIPGMGVNGIGSNPGAPTSHPTDLSAYGF